MKQPTLPGQMVHLCREVNMLLSVADSGTTTGEDRTEEAEAEGDHRMAVIRSIQVVMVKVEFQKETKPTMTGGHHHAVRIGDVIIAEVRQGQASRVKVVEKKLEEKMAKKIRSGVLLAADTMAGTVDTAAAAVATVGTRKIDLSTMQRKERSMLTKATVASGRVLPHRDEAAVASGVVVAGEADSVGRTEVGEAAGAVPNRRQGSRRVKNQHHPQQSLLLLLRTRHLCKCACYCRRRLYERL